MSICFDGGRSPDRHAALDALQELQDMAPSRTWRLLLVDASLDDLDTHRYAHVSVHVFGTQYIVYAGHGCCSCCTRHTRSWTSTLALHCGWLQEGQGGYMEPHAMLRRALFQGWCCWAMAQMSCVGGMGGTERSFG